MRKTGQLWAQQDLKIIFHETKNYRHAEPYFYFVILVQLSHILKTDTSICIKRNLLLTYGTKQRSGSDADSTIC